MKENPNKLITASLYFLQTFNIVWASCNLESYGLYCSNITDNTLSLFINNKTLSNTTLNVDVRAIFFRNISGELSNEIFSFFPKTKSLDIQSSNIQNVKTDNKVVLNNLYLMNNFKLPALSVTFFQKCCQKLMVLFVFDNPGLIIDDEAFQNLSELKHLTVSKQKVKHLNKSFLKGLNKLTYLNLRENGIETLDENTFQSIDNLNYLILSDNKITKFESKTFTTLEELESLEFMGLDLVDFNISIFHNQKEIKTVGLPTKLIKNLKLEQLTLTFRKLETIVLSDNDKASYSLNRFILQCEDNGFVVKFA